MAWVHYRTCVGIILIFDLSSRDSYESLKKWYEEILQYVEQEKIVIRLIGNKCDKLHYD
jgi:GTPase SAR1 family protein